jgi:hypothetical protein
MGVAGGFVNIYRFDTETYPIRPGLLAPKLVCLQRAVDDDVRGIDGVADILCGEAAADDIANALQDPNMLLEAHNGAFDQAVTSAAYPDLLPLWFKALGNGRGRDTQIRESLLEIRAGTLQDNHPKGWFSLGGIAERRCGITLDKTEDSWRLRYALLDGLPVESWPEAAVRYALDDVHGLRAVSRAQSAVFVPKDEWLQVAAAFCLHLAAVWGVRVDGDVLAKSKTKAMASRDECERILTDAGMFRDGSVDKKAVQAAVERACVRAQIPVPKTAHATKPQTKTDAETCETLAPYDSALKGLVEHTTSVKMLSTYLEPMDFGVKYAMTSRPNVLVASGRTSWSGTRMRQFNPWWPEAEYEKVEERAGTNMQNFPRMEGIRDCIRPRDGFWWCSVDYDSLELRSFAQVLLWVVGRSTMAERYQADPNYDPHTELAGKLMGLSYADAMKLKKSGDKSLKEKRQLAKAANFGYPGGLGAKRFIDYARVGYGVNITVQQAYELKDQWMSAFPEVAGYFEYVSWLAETGTPFEQFVSQRIRGRIGFTDGCNTGFQGAAADGAKRALYAVTQACYVEPNSPLFGSRVVAFIHDEICTEVPVDKAHEAAMEQVRLMEDEMQIVIRDVPIRASPALSTRWIKAAEAKYADGRLTAWDL